MGRSIGWMLVGALALGAGCDDAAPAPEEGAGGSAPGGAVVLKLVSWNVGNPDGEEPHYPLRLSWQAYEDHVGAALRALDADVVLLQEILPPQTCASFTEADPSRTCFDAAAREPAARRLLGDDYTIVCDARQHVECIGVKRSLGTIEGVEPGAFVVDGASTPPLPLPACIYADGACDEATCDAESTVSAVTVGTRAGPLRIVHAHPNAAGSGAAGAYLGAACRVKQLEQVFTGLPADGGGPLVATGPTVVAGDFNVDPERIATSEEEAFWAATIGDGRRFADLSARDAATGETFPTNRNAIGVAIDRVVTDVLTGRCEVRGTHPSVLPATGTEPLDAGFDFQTLPGGERSSARIDHFAVVCTLRLPAAD